MFSRYFLIAALFSLALQPVYSQDSLPSYVHYYQFGNYFLDLNTLERVEKIDFPAQGWKYASNFAPRYQRMSIDKMGFRGKLFEILPNNALKMTDMVTQGSVLLPNKEATAERAGQNFLISCKDGALYVKHLSHDLGFRIYKYDVMGSEVFGAAISHSRLIQHGTLEYFRPYLRYFGHTGWQVAFVSYDPETPKTCVLNAATGEVEEFNFTAKGIIRDEKEDNFVQGFIYADANKQWKIRYQGNDIALSLPHHDNAVDCFETVAQNGVLYMAAYSPYARGCYLWAFNLNTQQWLWKMTVPTPSLGDANPSYYYNTVWLSVYNNQLLLEGYEKDGKYLRVFDTRDGKLVWKNEKI